MIRTASRSSAVALATFVSLAPSARAQQASAPAAPTLPFTTHLVDVGHRHVAFHVHPGHQPAIVFISGGGMDGSAWNGVAGAIERQTGAELVTADRAGFGDSDEDTRPTRIDNEVDDLEHGLAALRVTGPIVLVAHSYGGEVALAFTRRDPARIAAAVLVDASIPSFFTDARIARLAATFPKGVATNKEERSQQALIKAYPAMLHDFHAQHWPRSFPITVIAAEHPPFAPPDDAAWIAEHRAFAHEAANRTFILARNSGHIVMNDRPDILVDAIVAADREARPGMRP